MRCANPETGCLEALVDRRRVTPESCRLATVATVSAYTTLMGVARIPYWVDYGTLLGAVHNGRMIPWDDDADFGIFRRDLPRLQALEPWFTGQGFDFCYHPEVEGEYYANGDWINITAAPGCGAGLDVFVWEAGEGGVLTRRNWSAKDEHKGRELPADSQGASGPFFPFGTVEWEGVALLGPHDPEWLVAHRYGPDWHVPEHPSDVASTDAGSNVERVVR